MASVVELDNTGESFLVASDHEATRMWKYGIAIWKLPGLRETFLAWQVEFGFDVSFLVFLCWVACVRKEAITAAQIRDANREMSGWRRTVIEPARTARKYVKSSGLAVAGAADVFGLLRAVELRSELCEQIMLLTWWRSQETAAIGRDGVFASIKEYVTVVSPSPNRVDDGELRHICGLIADMDVQE